MTRSLKVSALVSLVAYSGSAAAFLWHRDRGERSTVRAFAGQRAHSSRAKASVAAGMSGWSRHLERLRRGVLHRLAHHPSEANSAGG